MKTKLALILLVVIQMCGAGFCRAQTSNIMGNWKVEISFSNGRSHSLHFAAKDAGKGTFQLMDPLSTHWEGAKPSEAKWTQGEGQSVTFSGPVEFPIGNVGRDAGTLLLKGKFVTSSLITGDVEFSPLVGDGPSKHGTFKANRAE